MSESSVVAVVAIGKNRELGKGGRLLWHIPDDLKRFKELTLGHPIIMGRKTFESVVGYVGGPLPDRTNIIITRDSNYSYEGAIVTHSLEEAIELAKSRPGADEIHIGGGGGMYKKGAPLIDKLYLTLIDAEAPEADAFFPEYADQFTKKVFEEQREWKGMKYTWIDLERA